MTKRRALIIVLASVFTSVSAKAQLVLTGVVTDSIRHRPLAGALVQVARDSASEVRSTHADSLGVYRIEGLHPGAYVIDLFHPVLDTLGIDLKPRRVVVGASTTHADLAIPSAKTIESGLCPSEAQHDSIGIIVGHIRDAESGLPRLGTVTVLWNEIRIEQGGIHQSREQYPAKTDEMGWYALCGVPSSVDLTVSAKADSDESGVVELRVPMGELVIREFLVSHVDSLVPVYSASSTDSTRRVLGILHRGHARLAGVVHNDRGSVLGNAEVSVLGTGIDSHTSDGGRFSLAGLPSGTQTVEVRAIGFEPRRAPVTLVRDGLTSVDLVLDRRVQRLDAVTVYGKAKAGGGLEFQRRVRSGWGHILTPTDIAKRQVIRTSDLLREFPEVTMLPGRFGDGILVRGPRGLCLPIVYLNGIKQPDDFASNIDALAFPGEVTAIEVYSAAGVPAEFWGNECGSVVIWVGMLPR
ncbi:MAG TPA: carboxypeptidase regulatory-like domain-containing protein [Gemmatimonadaceae bacterium]|nr:carboxypeptidase regulatory-like domain-containing protein [Gemmatimonadaceae bacterium]